MHEPDKVETGKEDEKQITRMDECHRLDDPSLIPVNVNTPVSNGLAFSISGTASANEQPNGMNPDTPTQSR